MNADTRLVLHRNPLRLAASPGLWRAVGYLISYLALSWVLFSVAVTAATTAAALAVTIVAVPLVIAAASAVHWAAGVERGMLRRIFRTPVAPLNQRDPAEAELRGWTRARAAWRDGTWRELGYLAGLWLPLCILDAVVLSVWLVCLAGITLPLWYWAPRGTGSSVAGYINDNHIHGVALGYFPHGPFGPGAVGLFVHSLPTALLAAAGFAVLFLLFNYVLVATARMQGRVARALLGPPADPLGPARSVLSEPGPLGLLIHGRDA
ncbi:MAG TPA: sensor domain-containing protein [Streptosporangiaceae bacterium]